MQRDDRRHDATESRRVVETRAIAAAVLILCNVGMAADELAEDAPPNRKAAVIAAVHAQEARYRDVEYVVKITTRTADQGSADRASELTSLETRRVVLQGDRIFFSKREHERVLATKTAREELSAYDGVETRTVVAGNCVNVHVGRHEHPAACPAHSLALAHFLVNLPLSVYLGGTEAIAAHPNFPRFRKRIRVGLRVFHRHYRSRRRGDSRRSPLRESPRGPVAVLAS